MYEINIFNFKLKFLKFLQLYVFYVFERKKYFTFLILQHKNAIIKRNEFDTSK